MTSVTSVVIVSRNLRRDSTDHRCRVACEGVDTVAKGPNFWTDDQSLTGKARSRKIASRDQDDRSEQGAKLGQN